MQKRKCTCTLAYTHARAYIATNTHRLARASCAAAAATAILDVAATAILAAAVSAAIAVTTNAAAATATAMTVAAATAILAAAIAVATAAVAAVAAVSAAALAASVLIFSSSLRIPLRRWRGRSTRAYGNYTAACWMLSRT